MLLYNGPLFPSRTKKPCNDTIPQAGRENMIFGKPGKKVELYNKFSACFFMKSKKTHKKPNKQNPPKSPWKSTASGVETIQKRRHF